MLYTSVYLNSLIFQSTLEACPVCESNLGPPVKHSRVETSHLLTRDTFKEVTVLLQRCNKCCIVLQV